MDNLLKNPFVVFALFLLISIQNTLAQDVTKADALNSDIGDNLDLEAVASIFGSSKNLEDFENQLNDPKNKISNLDLNQDNQVDYLRVVEVAENNTHLIAIQAVLAKDQYQDVATIEVEKDTKGNTSIQVVGDVDMYGPHYIIEPVYVHPPVFFTLFWRPFYHPYHSIFYWGYYPHHFHYWHPVHINVYKTQVHIHINKHYTFRRTTVRRSRVAVNLHTTHRRNDYGRRHPSRAYVTRTTKITNQRVSKSGHRVNRQTKITRVTTQSRTHKLPKGNNQYKSKKQRATRSKTVKKRAQKGRKK